MERAGSVELTFTFKSFNLIIEDPFVPYSVWQVEDDTACEGFYACTHNYWCPNGYTQNTLTNVDPDYPGTGDQLFAHEVGHTYGIADCTAVDCNPGVTIMEPDQADEPYAPMSPHCCDSKLLYQMSSGGYGQSANYCRATLVQGTATLATTDTNTVMATFQQPPQSGDSIVVGCLGGGAGPSSFSAMDNQQPSNTYNPIVSASLPAMSGGKQADSYLLGAFQVSSSQSQPLRVTCSATGNPTEIDIFALEYADLGSGNNVDGMLGSNYNAIGVPQLSCGLLSTSANNDLVASLYNYNYQPLPQLSGPTSQASTQIAPTLGTVPACVGGQGGSCISYTQWSDTPQPGGVSVYPQNTPGQYTESWTAPLTCPPGADCDFPMSCASAALKVIGP